MEMVLENLKWEVEYLRMMNIKLGKITLGNKTGMHTLFIANVGNP